MFKIGLRFFIIFNFSVKYGILFERRENSENCLSIPIKDDIINWT